jgi:cytochrome c oxidase cbb3-type subunit 3
MSEKTIDELSGVSTTGHEWDGIKELNNPMPRWWSGPLRTIVWAIGYAIAYPAWPLIRTATTGLLGYSSRADVKAELAAAKATKADYIAAIGSKSVDRNPRRRKAAHLCGCGGRGCVQGQLRAVPRLRRAGIARLSESQRRRLAVGRQARSRSSRPSLTGSVTPKIHDTRVSEMPAFGSILKSDANHAGFFLRGFAFGQGRECERRRRSPRASRCSRRIARPVTVTTARAIARWARRI